MSDPGTASAQRRRYLLLVNPSAGGGSAARRLPAIRAALDAAGATYRVDATTGLAHGAEIALEAARDGEVPVVISGDGLIGRVGGALAAGEGEGEVPMGIIPGGRGNDLARVLGIPDEPEAAVANLLEGSTRRIDVGEANDVPFLCIASCGFDSDANRIANDARLIRGPLVYAYAALRALAQWEPATFEITADGERRRMRGYSVAAANSKAYGGGMFVAPDAELDDGLLDLVLTADGSRLGFLRSLPKVFSGTHLSDERVSVQRASTVEVSADRPFDVYADGELITQLPVTVRLRPAALSVIVGASR